MATASDMIKAAMQDLGFLAQLQIPTDYHMQGCLTRFNRMMDSWSIERLMVFEVQTVSFSLTASKASYTWGTGGDWSGTRPNRIERAYVRDVNSNDFPLEILTQAQWDTIGLKTVTSQIPDSIYYDPSYPLGTANLFPVPTLNYTIFLDVWVALTQLATLATVVAEPPGYARAIATNLALEIAPFLEMPVPDATVVAARQSKANVKRINDPDLVMFCDPALKPKSGTYNIYRG